MVVVVGWLWEIAPGYGRSHLVLVLERAAACSKRRDMGKGGAGSGAAVFGGGCATSRHRHQICTRWRGAHQHWLAA